MRLDATNTYSIEGGLQAAFVTGMLEKQIESAFSVGDSELSVWAVKFAKIALMWYCSQYHYYVTKWLLMVVPNPVFL